MEAKCIALEYFLYFFFSRAKGFCFICAILKMCQLFLKYQKATSVHSPPSCPVLIDTAARRDLINHLGHALILQKQKLSLKKGAP